MTISSTVVQKVYLAYFGRPADPVGLIYWQSQDVDTMKAGFSASIEYNSLYSGMTNTERVNQVYRNILGRDAEANGLAYWVGELNAGRQTILAIADTILNAALIGPDGVDKTTVNNRLIYSEAFTAALDTTDEISGYSGTSAAVAARNAIYSVTTDNSLSTAISSLNSIVQSVVSSTSSQPSSLLPSTYTDLGLNTFTIYHGTSGDDIFTATTGYGVYLGLGGNDTFNIGSATVPRVIFFIGGSGDDTYNIEGGHDIVNVFDIGGGTDSVIDYAYYVNGYNYTLNNQLFVNYQYGISGISGGAILGDLTNSSDTIEKTFIPPDLNNYYSQAAMLSYFQSLDNWLGNSATSGHDVWSNLTSMVSDLRTINTQYEAAYS